MFSDILIILMLYAIFIGEMITLYIRLRYDIMQRNGRITVIIINILVTIAIGDVVIGMATRQTPEAEIKASETK